MSVGIKGLICEFQMRQLESKFDKELNSDSHVVVCRFPLLTWKPVKSYGIGIDTVWVYKHPSNTNYTRITKPSTYPKENKFYEVDPGTAKSKMFNTSQGDNQTFVKDAEASKER